MTDLEIVKYCAAAMGLNVNIDKTPSRTGGGQEPFIRIINYPGDLNGGEYDPLNDDAQCMVLVKKFQMKVERNIFCTPHTWVASAYASLHGGKGENEDLNRAICECVAKMYAGKLNAG